MSEKLKEAVSAAIDDEADEFELRRVLDEVHKDPALKAAWDRYQLVGAVLRNEYSVVAADLRDAVWAELEMVAVEESPVAVTSIESQPVPVRATSRLNRATGIAVAATVALTVAIAGMMLIDDNTISSPSRIVAADNGNVVPALTTVASSRTITDQDAARTAALMLHHTQQLGMNQPGLAAFTKLVTYHSR